MLIKKTIRTIFLFFIFGIYFSTTQLISAACTVATYTTGTGFTCTSPMQICSKTNGWCCDAPSECSALNLATDCSPGVGGVPLGSCLKLSDSQKVQDVYTTPTFLVNLIVDNLFVAAGVVIFFMTLLAGFFFITGGKKGLEQAKQILLAVIVGFGIMFGAYWIVQIIKTLTGADILL